MLGVWEPWAWPSGRVFSPYTFWYFADGERFRISTGLLTGLQLSKTDDPCDIPTSLTQAIQEQLEAPYEFALPASQERLASAPTLRLEVTDILANAGGLCGSPKILRLHGVLERSGAAPVHFDAQRQMFLYFGVPRSTCNMVGAVTYGLEGDIANWLQEPVDGAQLGDLS